MPATFDIPTVRSFTEDLNEQMRRCDSGEGMVCSNLEETINLYIRLCGELRECINLWARTVFKGQIAFDQDVENLLKDEMRHLLARVKLVAARGRAMDGECWLQGLNELHRALADLDYLLENWVSPRLSVSPAPRVVLSDAVVQKIKERLEKL